MELHRKGWVRRLGKQQQFLERLKIGGGAVLEEEEVDVGGEGRLVVGGLGGEVLLLGRRWDGEGLCLAIMELDDCELTMNVVSFHCGGNVCNSTEHS